MEARQVLELLGEPINACISSHEVIEVDSRSVSWYTIETTWRRGDQTKKKQRFKYIQQALLLVRDAKDRLKLNVQLPMLPLSIIRGTSEIIRAQRASEFNAFFAAALSVTQLRVMPALVLLLAPDEIGSLQTAAAASVHQLRPQDTAAAPSHTSSDTSEVHASHAIQSLAHLGHSDMDSANWPSAEPSAVSDPGAIPVATQRAPTHAAPGTATASNVGHSQTGNAPVVRAAVAAGAAEGAHSAAAEHQSHAPQAHSVGFNVPALGRQFPFDSTETAVVATAPKVAAMLAAVERCKAAVSSFREETAMKDATIRQQQDQINRLQEELRRLRAP